MRILLLRAAALLAAVLLILLGSVGVAGTASADTVTTKTGQQLSVDVDGILAEGRVVAQGSARITPGPTTITTVEVSFDDHEEIPVGPDAQGRFEVDTAWPAGTPVTVRATVTASDGTMTTAVAAGHPPSGSPAVRHHPRHQTRHRHLADTGAPGPRVLAPLGALLVLVGLRLVTWGREANTGAGGLEEDRILGP